MEIIEQYIQGKKTNQEECEDGLFVGEHYIAVVDGATSKSDMDWGGSKSGKIAKDLIIEALPGLDAGLDIASALSILDSVIARWYVTKNVLDHVRTSPNDRCIASAVLFSKARAELWFIGDCQALVDGAHITSAKLVDDITGNARAMFLESSLRAGQTLADFEKHDTGRDYILPLLQAQSYFQNSNTPSEFNYVVLDGFLTNFSGAKVVTLPADAKEVILASDGYPELFPTLLESEQALQKILAEDPLLFRKYKSAKGLQPGNSSFDDRTYIRIKV